MQLLSSPSTYFAKFVMPVVLLVIACVFLFRALVEHRYSVTLVLFVFAVIFFLQYWFYGRAKKVSLDGAILVISDFRREARIPLSSLEKASGSVGMSPEVIWLYFREDTPFGKTILFLPPRRTFRGFNQHPFVAMLNAKVT
jgi:hypothetical protein